MEPDTTEQPSTINYIPMAGRKSYKQELSERKKQLKDAIAKAEKELSKRKPIDTRWFNDS